MCKEEGGGGKQAGSSLIHSPSRSSGHTSCKWHPTFHQLPSSRQTFRPLLTSPYFLLLLFSILHPEYILSAFHLATLSLKQSILTKFTGPYKVIQEWCCVTASHLEDDNSRRPGLNNASETAKQPVVWMGVDRQASEHPALFVVASSVMWATFR